MVSTRGDLCLSPFLDWEGLFAYREGMDNYQCNRGHIPSAHNTGMVWHTRMGKRIPYCKACKREQKAAREQGAPECPRGHKIIGSNALKRSTKGRSPECRICRNVRTANYRRRQGNKPLVTYPIQPATVVRTYNPYMIEDLETLLGTCTTTELYTRLEYSTLTSLKLAVTNAGRLDLLQRIELQRRTEEA